MESCKHYLAPSVVCCLQIVGDVSGPRVAFAASGVLLLCAGKKEELLFVHLVRHVSHALKCVIVTVGYE